MNLVAFGKKKIKMFFDKMKIFLIYIGLLLTVLGTSAASENIIKRGKDTVLFSKKEYSNYFFYLA